MLCTGVMIVSAGVVIVPACAVVVSSGAVTVSAGAVIVSAGVMIVSAGVVIVCAGVGSPRADDPAQEVPTPDPDRRPPAAEALPHCVRTVPLLQPGPLAL